jgi:CHC2 zinc finger
MAKKKDPRSPGPRVGRLGVPSAGLSLGWLLASRASLRFTRRPGDIANVSGKQDQSTGVLVRKTCTGVAKERSVFVQKMGSTSHPQHKAVAIGHAMRKLLHLVFAIWKTQRPFDAKHYPWDQPAHVAQAVTDIAEASTARPTGPTPVEPTRTKVTAPDTDPVVDSCIAGEGLAIDFNHVKGQLSIARVLDHLGISARLKGTTAQRRCSCPIHRGDARSRTFSVNLDENVYHCFAATCGSKGDVIDLWAAVHNLPLRAAALDLIQTFGLEPAPKKKTGTGKRKG